MERNFRWMIWGRTTKGLLPYLYSCWSLVWHLRMGMGSREDTQRSSEGQKITCLQCICWVYRLILGRFQCPVCHKVLLSRLWNRLCLKSCFQSQCLCCSHVHWQSSGSPEWGKAKGFSNHHMGRCLGCFKRWELFWCLISLCIFLLFLCYCIEVSTISLLFNGSLKNVVGPEDSVTFI